MNGTLKLTAALSCFAIVQAAQASILPKNDLHLQDRPMMLANMTEAEFNTIVNTIVNAYKPIVAGHGATLKSNNLWSNATVNASAEQQGKTWILNMYGGLARRPEVTPDGFAMVVCHELGHHLAGFPFYGTSDWASSEGQSDYFASQACARKLWKGKDAENKRFATAITAAEKSTCDATWPATADRALCYRVTAGGQSLANLLSALNNGGVPRTDTPDRRVARTTQVSHPQGQCRLDTYFAGGLCRAKFNETVIPGRNFPGGQTTVGAETVASQTSCMTATGWTVGVRPRCWYAPKLQFQALTFGYTEMDDAGGNGNRTVEPGETVAFNFALGNDTQAPTTKVRGILTSNTRGVSVTTRESQWPDIANGESKLAQAPFVVKVDKTVACGSDFELELRADSDQGSTSITKNFLVGKRQTENLGENDSRIAIPDNDRTGVTSEINSPVGGAATEAAVTVDIPHSFPTDLVVTLVSPAGKETKVYPAEGALFALKKDRKDAVRAGEEKGLFQTFNVKLAESDVQGQWKLKVVDKHSRDVGSLRKWGLSLSKVVCSTGSRVVKN